MPDALYPLKFEPIFKSALWGGFGLRPLFGADPSPEATGEAWLISDQGDSVSRVVEGPFAGTTLRELMQTRRRDLIGEAPASNGHFPLLLKLIDARLPLSVQVHPNDEHAARFETEREGVGKTEAWVILKRESDSRVYAGLRPGVGMREFRSALTQGKLPDVLHSFTPDVGDCVFLEAGIVHAIGAGLTLFEVQQTSDITYRLYDWGRVDPKTGRPRDLHIDQALACTDCEKGPRGPVKPTPLPGGKGERLVTCRYFSMDRLRNSSPFQVGVLGKLRIGVCIEGHGSYRHRGGSCSFKAGEAVLFPASVGVCDCVPDGQVTILECGHADTGA